jgi:hypothetical protein
MSDTRRKALELILYSDLSQYLVGNNLNLGKLEVLEIDNVPNITLIAFKIPVWDKDPKPITVLVSMELIYNDSRDGEFLLFNFVVRADLIPGDKRPNLLESGYQLVRFNGLEYADNQCTRRMRAEDFKRFWTISRSADLFALLAMHDKLSRIYGNIPVFNIPV